MPNRTPRVLYIDDDPALVRLLHRALERRGYAFEHAGTGEAGLERIAAGDIDVLALDHYLPTGTGLDVLKRLGEVADRPIIVYVTGSVETAVAIAALKAGASDYVLKTVSTDFIELLATAIDHAVERIRLQRAKAKADQDTQLARERAEMLLGEVNHRVANSLSMVAALVGLQANAVTTEEAKSALAETQARIRAIAGVHRHLYTSDDVRSVNLADYLEGLGADLQTSMQATGHHSRITVSAHSLDMPTEKVASIGVIVTELVTNAIKYAYAVGEAGEVRIRMQQEGDAITLRVEDDGLGWDGTGAVQGTGLGTRIVRAMAKSLDANVSYEAATRGTTAMLSFRT